MNELDTFFNKFSEISLRRDIDETRLEIDLDVNRGTYYYVTIDLKNGYIVDRSFNHETISEIIEEVQEKGLL